MSFKVITSVTAVIIAAMSVSVSAQSINLGKIDIGSVLRGGQEKTLTCNNDAKYINESGSTIKIVGQCASVTVKGGGNDVTIERTDALFVNGTGNSVQIDSTYSISVDGGGNDIRYAYLNQPDRKHRSEWHPVQGVKGFGNSLTWSKGVSAAQIIPRDVDNSANYPQPSDSANYPQPSDRRATNTNYLTGNNETKTLTCYNDDLVLDGNGNNIDVVGYCNSITIDGSNNGVVIENSGTITILGNGNNAQVDRTKNISVEGSNNDVKYLFLNDPIGQSRRMRPPVQISNGNGNNITWTKGIDIAAEKDRDD